MIGQFIPPEKAEDPLGLTRAQWDADPRSVVDNGAGVSDSDARAFATDSPGSADCEDQSTANIRHD